jgi:dTDP-glucose pyrophosphorylase
MTKQNIVITMAGRGSRFYQAGYQEPKYAIKAHGQSLFYWSMISLKNFFNEKNRFIFICLKENDSADYVRSQCTELDINHIVIIELDELTDGQATSAYLSRQHWLSDAPLLIYNIDTYVEPHALNPSDIKAGSDAWIPCFQAPGDHWSFVKLGEDGWATDCAEKNRISEYASIGLYWFAKAEEYSEAYEAFFADPANLVKGERYIAPMYRHYIKSGKKISIVDIAMDSVHVLGTPDELKVFLQQTPKN